MLPLGLAAIRIEMQATYSPVYLKKVFGMDFQHFLTKNPTKTTPNRQDRRELLAIMHANNVETHTDNYNSSIEII
jgi:hypothetical protein